MKGEKRERERFGEKLRRALELDGDFTRHGYTIDVRGRSCATIRGAGKILIYTPERIRLGVRDGAIEISGEGLVCASYCAESVGIEGKISSIIFEVTEK